MEIFRLNWKQGDQLGTIVVQTDEWWLEIRVAVGLDSKEMQNESTCDTTIWLLECLKLKRLNIPRAGKDVK